MINTHLVQFSGKVEIEGEIDKENYVLILGEFDISEVSDKPTGDGEDDRTYKLFPLRVEVKQGDSRLIGKPKRRGSQRLRGALWHEYQKITTPPMEFEQFYDDIINKLIIQLPEVVSFLQ